jgi:sugar lactone lactonase YvrE
MPCANARSPFLFLGAGLSTIAMPDQPQVACIADVKAVLGEGPVWVAGERALYWVDINARKIFRFDQAGALSSWETPMRVGSLAPRAAGGFVAGTNEGLVFIDLEDGRFDRLGNPEASRPDNRFNDGKVDRSGRFWAGTMDDKEKEAAGTLYRLDPDLRWTSIDSGYRVTNGPAFSPDGRVMYHNDSARRVTYAFDLDQAGKASNRREFARYGGDDGFPDGMTVDAEGCLWIAFWDGWCLRRLSPDGERLVELPMPIQRPTSCAFGGEQLDRLFITSARRDLQGTELDKQPFAGGLFAADVGVTGIADLPFAG